MSIGRKRWNLHDGPKGSLRRLRNQLAEDGCAESQVVLAKQLLEEKCELEADKISNFKQALDWLICATEQAHPEARRMLKRCIRSGVIDEDSAAIVRAKSCLAASRQETVARKAARDLFASLSNGEQYITTAQLERRIREICNTTLRKQEEDSDEQDDDSPDCSRALSDGPCERPQLQAGDQPLGNGTLRGADHEEDYPDRCAPSGDIRNLTVDNLVSAAVDYCQGELPLVSYRLTLSDPPLNALDHIPLLHQAFLHPIVFLQVLYLKLLLYFGSFNFRLSNVEVCLVFAAYLSVNRESVSQLAPALLYYASFAAMVVTTFKMLKAKRQFVDFRKWSGLFLQYSDGGLRPDESEELFVRNNLGPFVQFFAALLVNLSLAPFVPAGLAPGAELGVVALALALLTLAAFGAEDNPFPDAVALLSFAVNAIAKYPAEEAGWAGADEEEAPLALGGGVEVRLGARGLAALAGAALVLGAAARGGRRGRAGGALAHGVCVAWLQLGAALAARGSAAGAARGALLAALWLLAAPLAGAASVCLPVAALLQGVPLSRGALALCAALCVALALALSCALAATDATKKFVTPLQLLIGLSTLVYFGNQLVVSIRDDGIPSSFIDLVTDEKSSIKNLLKNEFLTDYDENTYHISWEDYYNHCNNPTWSDYNVAVTQIKCSVLDGANVHWEGYVKDVNVIEVKNLWNSISVWMPAFVREYFKCYYGEEYSSLCSETEGLHSLKECEFVNNVARQSGKTCHLNNLNEYTYEVKLTMEAGGGLLKRHAVLSVIFDHYFTNITRLLRTNDKVKFKGILLNENGHYVIGTKDLSIKAYEISCLECKETIGTLSAKAPSSTKISELISTLIDDCVVSTKYILNFILNPVVVFK